MKYKYFVSIRDKNKIRIIGFKRRSLLFWFCILINKIKKHEVEYGDV